MEQIAQFALLEAIAMVQQKQFVQVGNIHHQLAKLAAALVKQDICVLME